MRINTRWLMASASGFLAALGLLCSFAPSEMLELLALPVDQPMPLLLQLAGAALIGWALVNWTARGLIIGGIYSRPLTLGNLVHFISATLALAKALPGTAFDPPLVALTLIYALFALCFGYLVFGQGAACVNEA